MRHWFPLLGCLLPLFTVAQSQIWPPKTKVLHIGGIFPINGTEGWQGGMVGTVKIIVPIRKLIITTL